MAFNAIVIRLRDRFESQNVSTKAIIVGTCLPTFLVLLDLFVNGSAISLVLHLVTFLGAFTLSAVLTGDF
jgi:hypothetical protein